MTRFIYDTSEETRIKEIARLREKALHDEASALKKATEEGIAKGRAEGEAKGLIKGKAEGAAKKQAELIANMKAFGMTDEQINAIILGGQKR
jgi:flagellar biosynthesis/type III secretory pathway protein FliH